MNTVLKSVATEDAVQLFDSNNVPVDNLLHSEVLVTIKKEGDPGFTSKSILISDWIDRTAVTPGLYTLKFSIGDVDTAGIFRYRITPVTPGAFVTYQDQLHVVTTFPTYPAQDPPTLNLQTDAPPGVGTDPVAHNATLNLNGKDLANATSVTIDGVIVAITANTDSQIQVTVGTAISPGKNKVINIDTPGGRVSGKVEVTYDASSIPGSGIIELTGQVWNPENYPPTPYADVPVFGRLIAMPNLTMGVAWGDREQKVKTDSNGFFSLKLPRGVRVQIRIPATRYKRVFTTPNQATANIFTQIPNS